MSAADGYQGTLITVAGDSPTDHGLVPTSGVAAFQYALLAGHPHELTQADVLFRTAYRDSPGDPDDLRTSHWDEFFAPPRACLRTSPLPKKYGWGLHFDDQGRVALVDVTSAEYRRFRNDPRLKVVPAMHSARLRRIP